jgi:hypothetical protein
MVSKAIQCGFESHPGHTMRAHHGGNVGGPRELISLYPHGTVLLALHLSNLGVVDQESARICAVSVRAVRHWRQGDRRASPADSGRLTAPVCPRSHGRDLDRAGYAYLLGLYLGDGHITHVPRSYVLWVACSDAWPGLIEKARQAASLVMPSSKVFCSSQKGAAPTSTASPSTGRVFPQHGPGRKHERAIELEPGRKRSSRATLATSRAAFSTPMAAELSTECGTGQLPATAGMSIRGSCS